MAKEVLRRPGEVLHLPARGAQRAQAHHDRPVRDRSSPLLHRLLHDRRRLPHDAHASRLVRVREWNAGDAVDCGVRGVLGDNSHRPPCRSSEADSSGGCSLETGIWVRVGYVGEEDPLRLGSVRILNTVH